MAHNLNVDPCRYGVAITRNRDTVGMGIAIHYYSLPSITDSAKAHNVDTVWDLADIMNPINPKS